MLELLDNRILDLTCGRAMAGQGGAREAAATSKAEKNAAWKADVECEYHEGLSCAPERKGGVA